MEGVSNAMKAFRVVLIGRKSYCILYALIKQKFSSAHQLVFIHFIFILSILVI